MGLTIGIFDSGVGGLTVVRELKRLLPRQPLVYFGDTARTPYGTKGPDTIIRYARENADFLLNKGAGAIIIACHSAASVATEILRASLDVPVFEVVTPSVQQAVSLTRNKRIGLIGTRATVSSGIYPRLIGKEDPDIKVFGQPCPLLVPLVEEGWLQARETRMIIRRYLRPLKMQQVDTLVLGCTHYPLLKDIIRKKAGKRVRIVDPSAQVAEEVCRHLAQNGHEKAAGNGQQDCYFVSDIAPATPGIVKTFLGKEVKLLRP